MYICPYYPRLASKGSKHKYLSVLVGRLKDLDVSTPNVVKNMNVALRAYCKGCTKKREACRVGVGKLLLSKLLAFQLDSISRHRRVQKQLGQNSQKLDIFFLATYT